MSRIQAVLYSHLLAFLSSTALLSMAANALISTAPTQLPAIREFPQWAWLWFISAARQFWSLHHPQPPQSQPPTVPTPQPGQKAGN